MESRDFKVTDTNDPAIFNGDFVVNPSDQQHQQDIINSFTGFWKQFPLVGVGVFSYINSSGTMQELERSIRIQLQQDGYSVNKVSAGFSVNGDLELNLEAFRNG